MHGTVRSPQRARPFRHSADRRRFVMRTGSPPPPASRRTPAGRPRRHSPPAARAGCCWRSAPPAAGATAPRPARAAPACSPRRRRCAANSATRPRLCAQVVAGEPRHAAAHVPRRGFRGDRAGQKAAPQRAVADEADAEFVAQRQHLRLDMARPQRIFDLHRGHRMHRMGAADRRGRRLRKCRGSGSCPRAAVPPWRRPCPRSARSDRRGGYSKDRSRRCSAGAGWPRRPASHRPAARRRLACRPVCADCRICWLSRNRLRRPAIARPIRYLILALGIRVRRVEHVDAQLRRRGGWWRWRRLPAAACHRPPSASGSRDRSHQPRDHPDSAAASCPPRRAGSEHSLSARGGSDQTTRRMLQANRMKTSKVRASP